MDPGQTVSLSPRLPVGEVSSVAPIQATDGLIASNGISSPPVTKVVWSLLTPFLSDRLLDLADLIFILAH